MAENTNVFISDLEPEVDDEMLAKVFGAYGEVTWSKVMPSKGKPTSAAIVEFASIEQAKWVVENLNGNIAEGLKTPIQVAFKRDNRGKGSGKGYDKGGYGKSDSKGYSGGKGKGYSPYEGGKSYGGGKSWGKDSGKSWGKDGGSVPVCRNFQQWGECKFGDSCKFSHQ